MRRIKAMQVLFGVCQGVCQCAQEGPSEGEICGFDLLVASISKRSLIELLIGLC